MTKEKQRIINDILVVQPKCEPWPVMPKKAGAFGILVHVRLDCFSFGFQFLSAGIIICAGPLSLAICHIKKQRAFFDRKEAE